MISKIKSKSAFTLAEVLITLAIVGIVASITIPTLIRNYQKNQYITTLKKAYSDTQEVFKRYIADEGVTDLSQTHLFTEFSDEAIGIVMTKYIKMLKVTCDGTESCSYKYKTLYGTGGGSGSQSSGIYKFDTLYGASIEVNVNTGYSTCKYDESIQGSMKGRCGLIAIDVNGDKPPNRLGRDYFRDIFLGPNGNLYPELSKDTALYYGHLDYLNSDSYWQKSINNCGKLGSTVITNASGEGCLARIIEESWQMNY